MADMVARRPGRRGSSFALAAAPLAALAVACVPAHGPLMNPGSDCLGCHTGGSGAKRWTVAGTIYDGSAAAPGAAVEGATVRINDASGWAFDLRTNKAGNFYTAEAVAFPLRVCVDRHGAEACMEEPVPLGSCNACHGPQGVLSPESHARLFPIDAASKHAGLACTDCHSGFASPAPASFRCAQCHLARDAALATNHTVNTSNPAVVVSDFAPSSDACLRCHADVNTLVHRTVDHPSGIEGTPPHNGATCLVCHDAYRADAPWGGDFTTDPRSWPVGSGHGCLHCHPGGVLTPEEHARLFPIDAASKHAGLACTDCHSGFASPAPASFRCAQCHLARDAALATNHTVNTSNPAVVVPDFAPSSDACLRCHADVNALVHRTVDHPSGIEGTPPHNGATCLVCHDAYRADAPWGGDFTTDPRSWPVGSGHGCLHCHAGGVPTDG